MDALANRGYIISAVNFSRSSHVVEVEVLLYVHKTHRFIRDGSPGRPPDFYTAPEFEFSVALRPQNP